MEVEGQIREAIVDELKRQAEVRPGSLQVEDTGETLRINGEVNVDELIMVVMGSVAGGP